MSKSVIQIVNNTSQAIVENGTINLGSIIYRFGPNLCMNNGALSIAGAGYYGIEVSATILPSAQGQVTMELYQNGSPINGASATINASSTTVPVTLALPPTMVKINYNGNCPCERLPESVSLVLTTGAGTISNVVTQASKY